MQLLGDYTYGMNEEHVIVRKCQDSMQFLTKLKLTEHPKFLDGKISLALRFECSWNADP